MRFLIEAVLAVCVFFGAKDNAVIQEPLQAVAEPNVVEAIEEWLSSEEDHISLLDYSGEKLVAINTDEEVWVYLLVKDGTQYGIAAEICIDTSAVQEEGEVPSAVVQTNPVLLQRSLRLAGLQESIKSGKQLKEIAAEQAAQQNQQVTPATESAQTDCAANGSAICCGFQSQSGVRIICVCNTSNNEWVLCFDSKWQK